MMQASDLHGRKSGTASSGFVAALDDAVRQNPVSAALVAVGALWLLAGGRNITLGGASQAAANGVGRGALTAGGGIYGGARAATGLVAEGIGSVSDAVTGVASEAAGALKSVADTVGSTVSRTGELVGQGASQVKTKSIDALCASSQSDTSPGKTTDTIGSVQKTLADLFERQPLMLGAVGLAIGAAIAASLPVSERENELMGGSADAVKDRAGKLWDETRHRGADLAAKGLKEAEAHGLTPEAASQVARDIAAKVGNLAEKASQDLVNRTRR